MAMLYIYFCKFITLLNSVFLRFTQNLRWHSSEWLYNKYSPFSYLSTDIELVSSFSLPSRMQLQAFLYREFL